MATDHSNIIHFDLINEQSGSIFTLSYELFDHNGFPQRWQELFRKAVESRVGVQNNGVFYGSALNKEEDCVAEIQQVVDDINAYIEKHKVDRKWYIDDKPHMHMSQEYLNWLHKRFEDLRHHEQFNDNKIQQSLAALNTLIHRCEGFLVEGFQGCHIEVNFNQVDYRDFIEGDLELFTPDKTFGNIYLTYGITGVPVEAAFYAKPDDPPLPQHNYSSGCFLYFNDTYQFDQWDALSAYLEETWQLDVKDPKLAIGYIPLGKLITPYEQREEIISGIREHKKVNAIRIGGDAADTKSVSRSNGQLGFIDKIKELLGLKKKAR